MTSPSSDLPHLPLMIDNTPYSADATHPTITTHSTHLSRPYATYTSLTPTTARLAATSSHTAFTTWRTTSHTHRRAILLRTASLLRSHTAPLSQIYIDETSCPPLWAHLNITWAADHLEEMASRISTVMTGSLPLLQQNPAMAAALVYHEPIGPVLSIPPWNAGVFLCVRAVDTPLAVGCSVILKASEMCVRTQHYVAGLFREAGLPPGVLNVVQCRREDAGVVTEELVRCEAVRKVEFIGSAAVGRRVGELCGRWLKPVLMELGGKSPLVVCEDADLRAAAGAAVMGGFVHGGQVCFSTERVIVRREVEGEFVEALKRAAADWVPNGAVSGEGPRRTVRLVKEAVEKGAEIVFGNGELKEEAVMGPVILKGVPKEAEISDEESFGPVLALYLVDSDEEAIALANDTRYGLAAGVYSKDVLRALKIARQLEVGQAHVNLAFGTGHDEATIPVGVAKGSGFGRGQNGNIGLEEFLTVRTVTISETQQPPTGEQANSGN